MKPVLKSARLNPVLLALHIAGTDKRPHADLFQPRPAFPWSLVIMVFCLLGFAAYGVLRVLS